MADNRNDRETKMSAKQKKKCAVTDCIPISYLEAQKLSKKASMYLSLEAIATAHIYRL